jgi:hypothetical protein
MCNSNRYLLLAGFLASLTACDAPANTLRVIGVLAPATPEECNFSADSDIFMSSLVFNPTRQLSMQLNLKTENNLTATRVLLDQLEPAAELTTSNRITPIRFDLRWECDSTGFSADLGPFFLPQFSVDAPFCVDRRSETDSFVGFDTVPAEGASIGPNGGLGIVSIRPITAQLGAAINDAFEMASLGNRCCDATAGCDPNRLAQEVNNPSSSCFTLQQVFDRVAGPGVLSAQNISDIQKWRPYSIFDRSVTNVPAEPEVLDPQNPTVVTLVTNQARGPMFPMRMRGVLEGVTDDGNTIPSNETAVEIGLCRNGCGYSACTGF